MMNIIKSILSLIGISFITAAITGTVMYVCFPYIHLLFPSAVESGVLPERIGWTPCIYISWMVGIVFKTHTFKIENKFTLEDKSLMGNEN